MFFPAIPIFKKVYDSAVTAVTLAIFKKVYDSAVTAVTLRTPALLGVIVSISGIALA